MQLNTNQLQDAKEIISRQEIKRASKAIIMYKKDDTSLALFRIQASNHLMEILTRTIARKRLLKATRTWVNQWTNEPNDSTIGNAVRDFVSAIERESGLNIIKD